MWPNNHLKCLIFIMTVNATQNNPECKAKPSTDDQVAKDAATTRGVAPDPLLSQNSSCRAKCIVYLPGVSVLSWVPEDQIVYTTNVTVGTVSEIVYMNPTHNATVVKTSVDNRWSEGPTTTNKYPAWSTTDCSGTAFAVTAITNAGTTTFLHLAYPHTFVDYTNIYSWEGFLPASSKTGTKSCATATAAPCTRSLSNRPLYPQSIVAAKNDLNAPSQRYVPLWISHPGAPNGDFFTAAFPSENAFRHCTPIVTTHPTPTVYSVPKLFWEYTTVTVWNSSAAGCSNNIASTGELSDSTGPRKAPYRNFSTADCGAPTMITIVLHNNTTTTLYGDRTYNEYTRQSCFIWPNDTTGDRTGYYSRSISRAQSTRLPWSVSEDNRFGIPFSREAWTEALSNLRIVSNDIFTTEVPRPEHTGGAPPQQSMPGWQNENRYLPSRSSAIPKKTSMNDEVGSDPRERATQSFRTPDAAEASLIAEYFNHLVHDSTQEASMLQQIQSSNTLASDRHPVDPAAQPVDPAIIVDDIEQPSTSKAVPASDGGLRITSPSSPERASIMTGETVQAAANIMPAPTITLAQKPPPTSILTTIDAIFSYGIPRVSAMSGAQEVTLSGRTTTLFFPEPLPTYIPTTMNGLLSSTLAYIVDGRFIATVGQAITVSGQPTVLGTPDAVFVQIPTTVNGIATTTLAYIVSGPSMASIGQSVVWSGTTTVLTAPDLGPILMEIKSDGVPGTTPVHVLTILPLPTMGDNVILNEKTTAVSEPTEAMVVDSCAVGHWGMLWKANLVGFGAFFMVSV